MREIKFKVWDKDSKRYEKHALGMGTDGQLITNHNEDFVLQQFTGLHDVNGKEIWEGDILKNVSYGNKLTVVEWQTNGWNFVRGTVYEVIGNIYEHPHLLETNSKEA